MDCEDMKFFLAPTGSDLTIRTGEAQRVLPPFDYQGFQYFAENLPSFVALVKAKAPSTDKCIVFCNDVGFKAILNDTIIDRRQDTVTYLFDSSYSVRFQEWKTVLTNHGVFSIKEFTDFLKRRDKDEIQDIEGLLYAAQNFKYVTNTQGDFSFEDRNNYSFNIKINEAEGTVRVPKTLLVSMEIFKDSGFLQDVEIEIEVHRPKDTSERPGFLLHCPKYSRYRERAVEHQVNTLRAELNGYLIVSGNC